MDAQLITNINLHIYKFYYHQKELSGALTRTYRKKLIDIVLKENELSREVEHLRIVLKKLQLERKKKLNDFYKSFPIYLRTEEVDKSSTIISKKSVQLSEKSNAIKNW